MARKYIWLVLRIQMILFYFILFSDNANGGLRVSWVVLQLKKTTN